MEVVRLYLLPKCPTCEKLKAEHPHATVLELKCLKGACAPCGDMFATYVNDRMVCEYTGVLLDRAVVMYIEDNELRARNG